MKRHSVQLLAMALSIVAPPHIPPIPEIPKFLQTVPLAYATIRKHRHSGVAASRRAKKRRKASK